MMNAFNEGTSERIRKTLTWKTIESMEGTTNPAIRESEVVSSEERVGSAGSPQIEGKPLVLLRVKWRTILNKILEFWNLVGM